MDHPTIAVEAILSDAKMFYQMIYRAKGFKLFTNTYSSGLEKKADNSSISIETKVISFCRGLAGDTPLTFY